MRLRLGAHAGIQYVDKTTVTLYSHAFACLSCLLDSMFVMVSACTHRVSYVSESVVVVEGEGGAGVH